MARFARIDCQIRANRLILANRFRVPELNPFSCESRFRGLNIVMPMVPQSEIQVKFLEEIFKETDEKRGEILAKFSFAFRPSISREIGHQKLHTDSSTHHDLKSTRLNPNSFTTIDSRESPQFALRIAGPSKICSVVS